MSARSPKGVRLIAFTGVCFAIAAVLIAWRLAGERSAHAPVDEAAVEDVLNRTAPGHAAAPPTAAENSFSREGRALNPH